MKPLPTQLPLLKKPGKPLKASGLSKDSSLRNPNPRAGTKAYLIHKMNSYGGAINHRKYKRPFDSKKAVHIVLRSRWLGGSRSLLKGNRKAWTEKLIKSKANHYGIKLYKWSINSNHIHLLMKFPSAETQSNFLRDFSGSLALKIKKTFKIAKDHPVWDGRPFTSLVKHFPQIVKYIEQNRNEAQGIWSYKERTISYLEKILSTYTLNLNSG